MSSELYLFGLQLSPFINSEPADQTVKGWTVLSRVRRLHQTNPSASVSKVTGVINLYRIITTKTGMICFVKTKVP
jgi:hypothetical protein